MDYRFLVNEEGLAHTHTHRVSEAEAIHVIENALEEGVGDNGARVALGRTNAGRLLRVIFIRDHDSKGTFVITAYEPGSKPARALRRRLRRRT